LGQDRIKTKNRKTWPFFANREKFLKTFRLLFGICLMFWSRMVMYQYASGNGLYAKQRKRLKNKGEINNETVGKSDLGRRTSRGLEERKTMD
jgi:hypothetical protein